MVKKTSTTVTLVLLALSLLVGSTVRAADRQPINIPDIMGYKTLKCDFHMHTVFSDGLVWPTVRVDEAWRDGLDAIAITDHIEYQPHKDDIPTNHKRPYEIAAGAANANNIILIKAAELTRSTPPGHFNALFVTDIDALDTRGKAAPDSTTKTDDELILALEAARAQNAIVFWNHPDWQARDGGQVWFDIHTKVFDRKLVDGIEVVNGPDYYDQAFKWAIDRNLIIFGNSDVHPPVDPPAPFHENHRTITLVFAEERTIESLRDALAARRTVAWEGNQLFGKKEFLEAIIAAAVKVAPPHRQYKNTVYFEIANNSDLSLDLEKVSGPGPAAMTLPPHKTVMAKVDLNPQTNDANLSYKVTNLLTGPGENLIVSHTVSARR